MLYLETVESSTLELLKKLQRLPVLEQTRLVGGTALALQFGGIANLLIWIFSAR